MITEEDETSNQSRKLKFLSPEKPRLEKIPEGNSENQATPLLVWLKKQIEEAWQKEFALKKHIQSLVAA